MDKFQTVLRMANESFGIIPYDINCGGCEEWMMFVTEHFPAAKEEVNDDVCHYWISYNGKHYDAECHHGVEDYHDLPIFKNQGKTREAVLQMMSV